MKKILILIGALALILGPVHAQEKLKTKNGTITFEASVPSFEEVKASNMNVSAILNTSNGEFAALARDVLAAPRIRDKFLYAIMPPGWHHSGAHRTANRIRNDYLSGSASVDIS